MAVLFPFEPGDRVDVTSELNEIYKEVEKSGLKSIEEALEKKLDPLTEKIKDSEGEVISALIRVPDSTVQGHNIYRKLLFVPIIEIVQCGIITPGTKFNLRDSDRYHTTLVTNLSSSYELNDSNLEKRDNNFGLSDPLGLIWGNGLLYLWFMDRPIVTNPIHKLSRLELYIGNSESTLFLEKRLKGHEYELLRRLFNENLTETETSKSKKEKEFFKLFDQITIYQMSLERLARERDSRIKIAENTDHEDRTEDEVSIRLNTAPKISETYRNLKVSLMEAFRRKYETYPIMTRQTTKGVENRVDPSEFFKHVKSRYLK